MKYKKTYGSVKDKGVYYVYDRETYLRIPKSDKHYLETNVKKIMDKHIKKINK